VKVGDEITFKVGLQDRSMPHPVEDQIVVRIIEETAPSKPNKKTTDLESLPWPEGFNDDIRVPSIPAGFVLRVVMTVADDLLKSLSSPSSRRRSSGSHASLARGRAQALAEWKCGTLGKRPTLRL